ncbi:hypothetical protein B566_EDAN002584 [Ephemera danica]|nr:hypothetical protein B566_EDAN002584 [Ephemera danica]
MDVFNKLCNTVSSTVSSAASQLNSVLPGNPITREFEATKLIGSAGPGLLWKIYAGYKKSTRQEAAIFVFEKRNLDRFGGKSERESLLASLRKGVSQLTRLRHPRDSLAFVSEPIRECLANLLQVEEALFPVEVQYGLIQLAEALQFIHRDGRLLHGNLCPENVIVNSAGSWKLSGFDFCLAANPTADPQLVTWNYEEPDWSLPVVCRPYSDVCAPEFHISQSASAASDMFSLGCVAYSVFNKGKPLLSRDSDPQAPSRNLAKLKQITSSHLSCVPEGLREYIKMLLNIKPELRPDPHQFTQIEYFQDVGVKTLNYLDSLFQWDNLQKSQFYKGLPQILPKLPHRVSLHRVLPCLAKEFVNPTMVPFVLPNALQIAEQCTKEEFSQFVLPSLIPLTPADYVRSDVLPVLHRALDASDQQAAQELCLGALPGVATLIDYPAMKNALLPRILRLCLSTPHTSVRVNCLVCLGKLLEHLDKWLVYDQVLPFLPKINSREPAVIMGILGVYKLALTLPKLGISKEVLATQVLPFLFPLMVENALTPSQFSILVTLIKDMTSRVEAEQRTKLEQIGGLQREQQGASSMVTAPGKLIQAAPPQTELDAFFSSLGIDTNSSTPTLQSPPASAASAMPTRSGSLSLEDKQKLIRQQEEAQRSGSKHTSNGVPSNKSIPAVKPPPVTANKTSSSNSLVDGFLQNQLKQISVTPPQKPRPTFMPQPAVQPAWPGTVPNYSGGFQTRPLMMSSSQPTMMTQSPMMGMMTSPTGMAQQNMFTSQALLPSQSMMPLLPMQQQQQQQKPAKQLTAAEMQDLLS